MKDLSHQPDVAPAPLPAVRLETVSKFYGSGGTRVRALNDVSLAVPRGSFTAVMGPSGSGKSTFLQCASGLDRPTSGRTWLGDVELSALKEPELTSVRRARVGFIFQSYNLLSSLTVEQNITLPARLAKRETDDRQLAAVAAAVRITDLLRRRPAQLSGGQQQRAAIARAVVGRPDAVFADEPTGALDSRSAAAVLGLLRNVVTLYHQTVLMVTHDPVAASYADQVLFLADGRLVGRLPGALSPADIADRLSRLGEW